MAGKRILSIFLSLFIMLTSIGVNVRAEDGLLPEETPVSIVEEETAPNEETPASTAEEEAAPNGEAASSEETQDAAEEDELEPAVKAAEEQAAIVDPAEDKNEHEPDMKTTSEGSSEAADGDNFIKFFIDTWYVRLDPEKYTSIWEYANGGAATEIASIVSGNENVIAVQGSEIAVVGKGQTTVTVTAKTGESDSATFIAGDYATGISIVGGTIYLKPGESQQLEYVMYPEGGSFADEEITWTHTTGYYNNDENAVQISDSGVVTAVEAGMALVGVKTKSGLTADVLVHVGPEPERIYFRTDPYYVHYQKSDEWNYESIWRILSVEPQEASGYKITSLVFSDSNVADNSNVPDTDSYQMVNPGTTEVTVTTANGKTATATLVFGNYAEFISRDTWGPLSVGVDETQQLEYYFYPEGGDFSEEVVTWAVDPNLSSNPECLSVDQNGQVTGVSEGSAIVTATTLNGSSMQYEITVGAGTETSPYFYKDTFYMAAGGTYLWYKYIGNYYENVTVTVDDESILTFDADNREFTAHQNGTTTATLTVNGISETATFVVGNYIERLEYTPVQYYRLNETRQLAYTPYSQSGDFSNDELTWSVMGDDAEPGFSIDNEGNVTALRYGQYYAAAVGKAGYTYLFTVCVAEDPESIAFKEETIYVDVDDYSSGMYTPHPITQYLNIAPSEAEACEIVVTSSDPEVVSYYEADRVLDFPKEGTATVTVTANGMETSATFVVGTQPEVIPVETVIMQPTFDISLNAGETYQLGVTIYPENATDKSLVWTSSNEEAAIVDENGLVTAVSEGTAEITATASSGASTLVKVIVSGTVDRAYAILTDAGDMIFFKSTRLYANGTTATVTINEEEVTGKIYSGVENTDSSFESIPWNNDRDSIRTVRVAEGHVIAPKSMAVWFFDSRITSFIGNGFDTSQVTSMEGMFSYCSRLTSLDLSAFNTSSVTSMKEMFAESFNLQSLDLGSFDTSAVTTMPDMFSGCEELQEVVLGTDFTNWINEAYLGGDASYSWTNGSVTKTGAELYNEYPASASTYAGTWTKVNAAAPEEYAFTAKVFYVSNGTSAAIDDYLSIVPAEAAEWPITVTSSNESAVTYDEATRTLAFLAAGSSTIRVYPKDGSATLANFIVMEGEVSYPYAVLQENGDLVFFRSAETYTNETTGSFRDTIGTVYDGMVFTVPEYSMNVNEDERPWSSHLTEIVRVYAAEGQTIHLANMKGWFQNCTNLTSFVSTGFDASNDDGFLLHSTFDGCTSLTEVDLSALAANKAYQIPLAFRNCTSLRTVDLSGLGSHDANMGSMFAGDTALEYVNFGNMSPITADGMFGNCSALQTVVLSSSFRFSDGLYLADDADSVWQNGELTKTAAELCSDYNAHAEAWAGTWTRTSQEEPTTEAYAILTDDGDLVMFRSSTHHMDIYTEGVTTSSYTDKDGNIYEGLFYQDIEDRNGSPWTNQKEQIRSFRILDGYTIAPVTLNGWFNFAENLTSVDVTGLDTSRVTSMVDLFRQCTSLQTLDLRGFDTSSVTDMSYMFFDCTALTSVDLSSFRTTEVTNMNYMFEQCTSLQSLDLSSFVTPKLTTMNQMFTLCGALETLDLSNFNTSQITTLDRLFDGCSSLTTLDLSSFDTSNVTNMAQTFNGCEALASLDIRSFNTENVTTMGFLFQNCKALPELDLSNFNTAKVTNMASMFAGCEALTELDLSSFDTSRVTGMRQMFMNCKALTTLDLSSFDTSAVTSMQYMFYQTAELKEVALGAGFTNWLDNAYLAGMPTIYWRNGDLKKSGDELYKNYGANAEDWFGTWERFIPATGIVLEKTQMTLNIGDTYVLGIRGIIPGEATDKTVTWSSSDETKVRVDQDGTITALASTGGASVSIKATANGSNGTNVVSATCYVTVNGTSQAYAILTEEGDMIFFRSAETYENNTSQTITINGTEYSGTVYAGFETITGQSQPLWKDKAASIKTVRVVEGDTIAPQTMAFWFADATELTSFDARGFDTSSVTNMYAMFLKCSSLTELDLSGFDTSAVTGWGMDSMFNGCSKLTSLDIRNFNTSGLTTMNGIFDGCSSLTTLDVSSFDTSNVKRMVGLFDGCSSLTSLDVSGFDTSAAESLRGLFRGCSSLTSIDASRFNTSNVTDMNWMFADCTSLASLDLSSFDTSKVTDMGGMFAGSSALTSLDLSSFDTSKVGNMASMFYGCSSLTSLDLSNFHTDSAWSMYGMFAECPDLASLDISSFNTANVTVMTDMFKACSALTSVDLGSGFTNWIEDGYLPETNGYVWTHNGLYKTSTELGSQYPTKAADWKGTWTKVRRILVTNLELSDSSISLQPNQTKKLTVTVTPTNALDKSVTWSSGNNKVATVASDGTVKAVGNGTTTITVTAKDGSGKKATCTVTVTTPVSSVSLDRTSLKLGQGKTYTFEATVAPSTASNKTVSWKSSDTTVITVDTAGKITAKKAGTATVTATAADGSGKKASCTVTVLPKPTLSNIYNSASGADIRWKPVEGVNEYVIMKKTNGVWEEVVTVKASSLTKEGNNYKYIDGSIKGKEYYGKGYIYSVAVKDDLDNLIYNTTGLAFYRLNPPEITSIKVNSSTSVTVNWDDVPSNGYEIQYSSDGGKSWSKVTVDGGDSTSKTITGLESNTTYSFRMRCQKTNSARGTTWSQYSTKVSAKTSDVPAPTPTPTPTSEPTPTPTPTSSPTPSSLAQPVLVAIYNSVNGADLRWKEVEGATDYVIMRKEGGIWKEVITVSASSLTKSGSTLKYIDKEVKTNYGKGYIYSVKAKNGSAVSSYNTTGLAFYRLDPPVISSVKVNSSTSVTVNWSKVSADGYEIQYTSDGSNWTKVTVDGSAVSHTITGLTSGTRYTFRMRCQKTNKARGTTWSQYSSQVKATTK